ncbi:murein tripeptide amidase MpaA [Salirhabdus euzebyi]|uniref:Murein tripeptide amidase MpaA n=1 Tax=Salirhabdus euzebyi TaxID=394506 RepID=A0A841Q2W5_9BACI|nr:M14 family metallocarboxypeptidase [Salirhabdus euzebyi]MBB6451728.1 murein tripeptide amidase MpaA [Salirhabdus euzebyi]
MFVQTDKTYTYDVMEKDLEHLQQAYPDLVEVKSIGKTVWGRHIYLVKLGFGGKNVFFSGSHHAREWLTTMVNMKMIEEYANAFTTGMKIGAFDVKTILSNVTIYFVPMVNPDGVTLQQKGLQAFPSDYHEQLIEMNEGSTDFTSWKANAEGIDLNRQYPAKWDDITQSPLKPASKNYKGEFPLQAVEAKVLYDLTYELKPSLVAAYHTAGRELFWHFHNKEEHLDRDYEIARMFCALTGYELNEPTPNPSGGGYKDWFVQEFAKPGLTPELAIYPGERHVDIDQFDEEWKRNKEAGLYLAEVVRKKF